MSCKIIKYVFLSVFFICLSNFSYAQSYPIYKKPSAIAVLDQDSLFSQSDWGIRILKSVDDANMGCRHGVIVRSKK